MLETLSNTGININEELNYYRDLSTEDWTDIDYFETLTRAVFGGIRNGIIEDRWSAISEAFSNFDFYEVAKYGQAKLTELMQNDKIIRHKTKIEATIENAEKMVQIVRRWGSFNNYINFFSSIESLVDGLQGCKGGFIGIGETNVYEFLKEIGIQTIKPDRQVTKIFFRLGVIGEKASLREIAETGMQMAKEVNERPCTVDWVLWRFGSEVCKTKNANCDKCSLALVCAYRKGLTTKN